MGTLHIDLDRFVNQCDYGAGEGYDFMDMDHGTGSGDGAGQAAAWYQRQLARGYMLEASPTDELVRGEGYGVGWGAIDDTIGTKNHIRQGGMADEIEG